MRKAVIGGVAAVALIVAALVLAPTLRGQGRDNSPRPDLSRLLLAGGGSEVGVSIRELTDEELARTGAEPGGVYVEDVREESPAADAGLRAGDIVVEFDGERVRGVRHFARLVAETPPGRTVNAAVIREGSRQALQVTPERPERVAIDLPGLRADLERGLRTLPRDFNFDFDFDFPDDMDLIRDVRLGMRLEPLTPQLAAYFGVETGVLVSSVDDGSPAAAAGIRAGDVIVAVGGVAVDSVRDVTGAARRAQPGSALEFRLMRDRQEVALSVGSW